MVLGISFLSRYPTKLGAYNALQTRLMRHYIARGGCAESWCDRLAPRFRARYGWMLDDSAVRRDEMHSDPKRTEAFGHVHSDDPRSRGAVRGRTARR